MQEAKLVRLRENPFLASLIEQGMAYQGSSLDKEITIVAVKGNYDDWAAYFETPWTPFGAALVAEYGNKLPEATAAQLFPDWAKRLKWRP